MKTSIVISGQISGNLKLRNAIITADCIEEKGQFNTIILNFKTKGEAVKALSDGYQSFCVEMPEEKGCMAGFRYTRGHALYWDASQAVINTGK